MEKFTLEQRVADFLSRNDLTRSRKPLLVAVSGGPDSVCLLHVLNKLKKELGLKLHVVHLDHRLRNEDSTADAQFVLDLCHTLGIPVTIEQHNVRAYQKEHKISLEEAAREVRYGFFSEVAESTNAKCVVVAHTLDDHIETILLNLIRGTGTRGLRGLQPVRYWRSSRKPLTIVRPLLEVSRKETAEYCSRHHLQPRIDVTNLSIVPTRNRIRLKLVPLLKNYNPDIVKALVRTAEIASHETAFLDKTVDRYWSRVVSKQDKVVVINKQVILKLPVALQRIMLRRAIEEIIGTLKDIEARHIEEMLSLLSKPAGKRINLPYGLFFNAEYDRFLLGKEPENISPFPLLDDEYPLSVPGVTEIPSWKIRTDLKKDIRIVDTNKLTAHFDYDRVIGALLVRPRYAGDRFQPLGMDEEKKVGRFMIDARIPRLWRPRIPILCDNEKLLWVVGYRISETVKVTEETKRVLRIEFRQLQSG